MILIPILEMGSVQLSDLPKVTEQLMIGTEFEPRSSNSRLCHHLTQLETLDPRAPSGGHCVT